MNVTSSESTIINYSKNIVVQHEEIIHEISLPKNFLSLNSHTLKNPKLNKLGLDNFTKLVPIDKFFENKGASAFSNGNIYQFVWNPELGGDSTFDACKISIVMDHDFGVNPDWPVAHRRWTTLLTNQGDMENIPNFKFESFGEKAPPLTLENTQ